MDSDYELIDSGAGRKLERFGEVITDRPCTQALWGKQLGHEVWGQAHAHFERISDKDGHWSFKGKVPQAWNIQIGAITLKVSPTPFGHLGIFPEHLTTWNWLKARIDALRPLCEDNTPRILNLFAYSGASTMTCAKAGALTVHLDASKPMIGWAKENASLSAIPDNKIIWVLDDVAKFLEREIRRGRRYDGIILDPPSFGRGPKKELFKIESDLVALLSSCQKCLNDGPQRFILASCHTPALSPQILQNMMVQVFAEPAYIESGEMMNSSRAGLPLPTGLFCHWTRR
jgi:23S rRNA (cytosine1962-C5)-methyltransferase